MYVACYFQSNWTLKSQIRLPYMGTSDNLFGVSYNAVTACSYFTGWADSDTTGYPAKVGSGSLVGLRWFMNNMTLQMLVRFGAYGGTPFQGGSIQYDDVSQRLVVGGIISSLPYSVYGSFDALVLVYDKNLQLEYTFVAGGSGSDLASTVQYPYVMLSVYAPAAPAFGVGVSGPGLLNLNGTTLVKYTVYQPYVPAVNQFTSTVTTEMSTVTYEPLQPLS